MSNLTIDQKIELLKLAAQLGTGLGHSHQDVDATLSNYNKMTTVITNPKNNVIATFKIANQKELDDLYSEMETLINKIKDFKPVLEFQEPSA